LFKPSEVDQLAVEFVEDLASPPPTDAIVIQAFHADYERLDWGRFRSLRVLFDGRGSLSPQALQGLAIRYLSIASPDGEAHRT
jgi:hypothetical protein